MFSLSTNAMEQTLIPVAEFLEELRFKRTRVAELERENSRLNVLLVEKDAEIHGKELQYRLRDDKYFKDKELVESTINDYRSRYHNVLEENKKYQAAISEKHELYVQSESEKKILEVKLEQTERKMQELCENTHYMNDTLSGLLSMQEQLGRDHVSLEEKYHELMKANTHLESYVTAITVKAEEKWKLACHKESLCEQLKIELSNTQARLQLLERGKSPSANLQCLQSEIEVLQVRLSKAEEREGKLVRELEIERQKRLSIEKEFVDALNQGLKRKQ